MREPKTPAKNKNMKTTKSILAVSAVAALFASSVFAAEPLLTPRLAGAHKVIAKSVTDRDYVHNATTTGNAAKAKNAGPTVVAVEVKDPNLLGCERVGKATCSKNPCDGKMVAICCKK